MNEGVETSASSFCDGIQAALYSGETDEDGESKRRIPEGAKVGFVTYDQDIHFYNINVSSPSHVEPLSC